MIDSHCHLTDPRIRQQLDDVLRRAESAGVDRLITVGTDLADDQDAVSLCRGRDNIRCTVGIHPNYVAESHLEQLARVRELAQDSAVLCWARWGWIITMTFPPRIVSGNFSSRSCRWPRI